MKDEIIRMAAAAGFEKGWVEVCNVLQEIEALINLAKADEREACAKVCDELAELNREHVMDSMWQWEECAAAIRAKGNA